MSMSKAVEGAGEGDNGRIREDVETGARGAKENRSDRNMPEGNRRAELEARIRRQVACEQRAFRYVERLLDDLVTVELLKEAGRHIMPTHYHDITEERAINKQCGYPICNKPLGNIPKQKYHISLKSNTVYDITERKKFCSNQCYKASMYFEKQIPTSPVWAREDEEPPQFTLLPLEQNKGSVGEVVVSDPRTVLRQDVAELSRLDNIGSKRRQNEEAATETSDVNTRSDDVTTVQDLLSDMMIQDSGSSNDQTTTKTDRVGQDVHKQHDQGKTQHGLSEHSIKHGAANRTEHSSVVPVENEKLQQLFALIDKRDRLKEHLSILKATEQQTGITGKQDDFSGAQGLQRTSDVGDYNLDDKSRTDKITVQGLEKIRPDPVKEQTDQGHTDEESVVRAKKMSPLVLDDTEVMYQHMKISSNKVIDNIRKVMEQQQQRDESVASSKLETKPADQSKGTKKKKVPTATLR